MSGGGGDSEPSEPDSTAADPADPSNVDWPAGSLKDPPGPEASGGEPTAESDQATDTPSMDPDAQKSVLTDDEFNVETLVLTLEEVTADRDSHLHDLQRMTADFSNFRKQATKRQSETITSAGATVVEKLLPVLDACEAALAQGSGDVQPIFNSLMDILSKEGLEHINPAGETFDPEQHEAVMHEPGEGDATVVEVLRTGYAWNGKVIRPAMVKVQG